MSQEQTGAAAPLLSGQPHSDEESVASSTDARLAVMDMGWRSRAVHVGTSALAIFIFVVSLFVPWRSIDVDLTDLLDDPRAVNDSIFCSRSQNIFFECYYDTPGASCNRTVCQKLLYQDNLWHPFCYYLTVSLIESLMAQGCVIVFLALLCACMQGQCYMTTSPRRYKLHCATAAIRGLNTIAALVFFMCGLTLNQVFKTCFAYPVAWPLEVQEASIINDWQAGPFLWIAATISHITTLALDVLYARCFETPVNRPPVDQNETDSPNEQPRSASDDNQPAPTTSRQ